MCYTISITSAAEAKLVKALGPQLPKKTMGLPRYAASGFSHPDWPVITAEPKKIELINWGFIPQWTPTRELADRFRKNNLNAKSETIFEKRSFQQAIVNNRCLIPVTGFFEWRHFNRKKYPYHIQLNQEAIFYLGGIYDDWTDKETGEVISTFSIITTAANELMSIIHNQKKRMPLIFTEETAENWLQPCLSQVDLQALMTTIPSSLMKAHTISKLITSRSELANSAEALLPFTYPELALLDL